MKKIFYLFSMLLIVSCLSVSANASISDTVFESGVEVNAFQWALTNPLQPWDFNGQNYLQLTSIGTIEITLTMLDGDTSPGEVDFNSLTLFLDDIDTGIYLNGFGNDVTITKTFVGITENSAAILAALKTDGKLIGTVKDHHTEHAGGGRNGIGFPAIATTTLSLSAVPLPSSAWLLGPGLVGLVGLGRKRRVH